MANCDWHMFVFRAGRQSESRERRTKEPARSVLAEVRRWTERTVCSVHVKAQRPAPPAPRAREIAQKEKHQSDQRERQRERRARVRQKSKCAMSKE